MSDASTITVLLEPSFSERKMARRKKILALSLVVLLSLMIALGIWAMFRNEDEKNPAMLYGEPLYLTPYIKSGKIADARHLSLVQGLPDTPPIMSYSGFFTVNETYDSNIFFWFVPALVCLFLNFSSIKGGVL